MTPGNCIKKALDRAGKNQAWLARELDASPRSVSDWCNSDNLRTSTMRKVQAVLHVPEFAALLGEKPDEVELTVRGVTVRVPQSVVDTIEASDDDWYRSVLGLTQIWSSASPAKRRDLSSLLRLIESISHESEDNQS